MGKEKIFIFDTTLRDGEQSPGATLTVREKLEVARQLKRLNVDVIEAGFPISSPGDFEAVKLIAQEVKGPYIAGLARAVKQDIDKAWEALQYSEKPLIHTFIATSDIHLKYQLKKTREEVLKIAVEAVKHAKQYTYNVEFSAMDASRSDLEYLCQVFQAAIEAGATIINVPDTVGYALPEEFGLFIEKIREKVPDINRATLSVHCHNDLGLATANSLAAFKSGVRQVECTINGIGERAGNASLEEVVMAIKTRQDFFNFEVGINTQEIYKTSRLVSHLTGIPVQPNKAIVGANAFAHESGIHQDGILKERTTYEIMTPESIGLTSNKLVLGKHSGRHAFRKRLSDLGYELKEEELDKAFQSFKALCDKKKEVYDEDLIAIVEEETFTISETFHLEYIHTTCGSQTIPTATIVVKKEEEIIQEAACGDGPVDAVYKAIDRITGIPCELVDYSLKAVTKGKDALGEVTVKINSNGETVVGRGVSTDIIEASAKAYVNALNTLIFRREKKRGG